MTTRSSSLASSTWIDTDLVPTVASMTASGKEMIVDCQECPFREVVAVCEETTPAAVVVAHGRETGHTLSVAPRSE
ncbi:MAG: hypothetical protein ABEJ31_05620 [Haloarculaceae archaeon]